MSSTEIVQRFRGIRALVVGDAMLDSYLEGTASRLCSEGPVPVVRKTAEQRAPGGAANAAANLRALGAEVFLLGVIGPDPAGHLLRSALRERGLDDAWLVEDPAAQTLHKLRILADGQYVVRFDEGETRRCSAAGQQALLDRLERLVPRCDVVVVSDYSYGVASERVIGRLRALRSAHACPLVVDSKDVRRFHAAGATVITPNHLEARLAVDPAARWDGRPWLPEVEAVARRLLALVDAEHAAITLAADGVLLAGRDGTARHLPAHPVAHANEVGAGDSFTAALALALGAGAGCAEAATIGIDAAGIAVTKRRTAVVQHQELLQRVSVRDASARPARGEAAARAVAAGVERERLAGRTIVFTNGVFDILHAGHVDFLRRARELGDVLVVGVNSDRSARRLKGAGRPINAERERLALVAALDAVDHALLFDEENPAELIRLLRPHIHVKGGDYAGEDLPEAEAVRAAGGRVVILPLVGSLSTSAMIDRIVAMAVADGSGGARSVGGQP